MYATALTIPAISVLFYVLNPPQCPVNYTQEQIDASRCIVGANIGGLFVFLVLALLAWFISLWLVSRILSIKKST